MAFKIGFMAERSEKKPEAPGVVKQQSIAPKKSVVQAAFPGRGASLASSNDLFDLPMGVIVYAAGKLEGQWGRVTDIAYNLQIKVYD